MRYRTSQSSTALWVVIGLNLLFFLATIILPGLTSLLALTPAYVLAMPWTILTCLFVHGGFTHILFNMITLYFFGNYLSVLLGSNRFLLIYFVGGIIGSLFFVLLALLLGSEYTSVVGASGAIFALGGALAVMRPRLRVIVFPIPAPIPIWAAVIGGFLLVSFLPGVAWQAHLGGLLAGLIAGFCYRKKVQAY